jgi:hypothetical protein
VGFIRQIDGLGCCGEMENNATLAAVSIFQYRCHQKNIFFAAEIEVQITHQANFHILSLLTSFPRHQLLILLFPHAPRLSIYLLYVWWRVICNFVSDVRCDHQFLTKRGRKHFYLAVTDKVRVQITQ